MTVVNAASYGWHDWRYLSQLYDATNDQLEALGSRVFVKKSSAREVQLGNEI